MLNCSYLNPFTIMVLSNHWSFFLKQTGYSLNCLGSVEIYFFKTGGYDWSLRSNTHARRAAQPLVNLSGFIYSVTLEPIYVRLQS
jgi:hypothetical protein